ncbi:MAG: hypothetical protein ABIE94_04330 [archaeon]
MDTKVEDALENLREILRTTFVPMAEKYGVSPAEARRRGIKMPELTLNAYIDPHSMGEVSTIDNGDVSMSAMALVWNLHSGDYVTLIEIMGEECGHLLRNALKEPTDFEKLEEYERREDKDGHPSYMWEFVVSEMFGFIGRHVFRDCFNPQLMLSHERYLQFGIKSMIEQMNARIREDIDPAILKATQLGEEVKLTEEGFAEYRTNVLELASSLMGEGYYSDDFIDKQIWTWFQIGPVLGFQDVSPLGLEEALDYGWALDECHKYLAMKTPENEYEAKSLQNYRETWYPQLFAEADEVDEDTLRQRVLEAVFQSTVRAATRRFEILPDYLRNIDLADPFVFHDREHSDGYSVAYAHRDDILSDLPSIVRLPDKDVYQRFCMGPVEHPEAN